eukprot:g33087.t1
MPRTAQLTDRIAVIRSMHTGDNAHSSSGYQMLTGIPHNPLNRENALPGAPNDWPSLGALVRTQRPDRDGMPAAITLPRHIANVGEKLWPGQDAGFLGRQHDPWLLTCDPSAADFRVPDLTLPKDVTSSRLNHRLSLLKQVNQKLDHLDRHAGSASYDLKTRQAVRMLTGRRARNAFDLSQEKAATRDRYGRSKFGQSVLLARRLIEAGTSLVQVNWQRIEGKENNGSWDTHLVHHKSLKGWLMPIMDRAYSALIEDLETRGLLDETLIAWVGEFGHTPRINRRAGRDHWGRAFSIALAGGGIRGGVVHGATDAQAGEVISGRVEPRDYAATVIDFWKAESKTPTPMVLYIHGGGWQGGDKSSLNANTIRQFLKAGISVAAINYRYVRQAAKENVKPPVKASLGDAARALQFIRSKSKEWNLDKKRIGATGGSAGGCSSLWLALHDDLAQPDSKDPIARESTRLYCAAVNGAQTTLDPQPLLEWMPNYRYGAHAFGLRNIKQLSEQRENLLKWIQEYSPMTHVSKDDPPIAMFYRGPKPVKGDKPRDPTHSALLGVMLEEKLKAAGVDVVLVCTGRTDKRYRNAYEYLLKRLKK